MDVWFYQLLPKIKLNLGGTVILGVCYGNAATLSGLDLRGNQRRALQPLNRSFESAARLKALPGPTVRVGQ